MPTATETETKCPQGGRCEGDGWCIVTDRYVDGLHPWPDKPAEETGEALARYAVAVETCRIQRASAARTVYPCKRCNTAAFHRWAGRHWTKEHDRRACDECETTHNTPGSRTAYNERSDRVENEPAAEPGPPTSVYEERMMDL